MKKFKFTFIAGLLVLLVVFFTWWNNQGRPVGDSLLQSGDKTPSVIIAPEQKEPPLPPSVISSANPPAVVQEKPIVQTKPEEKPAQTFSYKGVDGKNALELLKINHKVETKDFSGLGEYVEAIDGIKPDSKHFWKFFINGKSATVGAGTYVTKNSDMLEWEIDKIGNE